jgi:rhamnosyl/mannosyltransferase
MPRLTIVHAAKFYPPVPGGMETVIADLCNGTAGEWNVRVVAAHTRSRTQVEDCGAVRVVRSGTWATAYSVPLAPSLPFRLWAQEADCVVLHEPNPLAGTALFLGTPRRRLVVWHHSDLVNPSWAPHTYGQLQRALYRRAECVIVSSPNLAADSPLVREARRVAVIPFGIWVERYRGKPDAVAAVEQLRANRRGPFVLFVGRFVYYKGVEVLIDAMAKCAGTLVLVGEGPLEPALRQRAAALGIEDRVVFAGRVPDSDLPAWYHAADLFVLPSIAKTEAFGVVQVEAMAAGLPVISTSLPTGVPWVNQHGVTGLVVPPRDVAALANAITLILDRRELREAFARNAAARAEAHFSRGRMVAAFRDVVEAAVYEPDRLARIDARVEV